MQIAGILFVKHMYVSFMCCMSCRYKGQFALYAYFLLTSAFLRSISPPLALMTAQEAALAGNFRNAHQR